MITGEVMKMIVFCNILQLLGEHGYSTYRLRQEKLLAESTIDRIRKGTALKTDTLDVICRLCQCQPGDLVKWVLDEE